MSEQEIWEIIQIIGAGIILCVVLLIGGLWLLGTGIENLAKEPGRASISAQTAGDDHTRKDRSSAKIAKEK